MTEFFSNCRRRLSVHKETLRKGLLTAIFLVLVFQILRIMDLTFAEPILPFLTVLSILLASALLFIDEADWTARLESDCEAEKKWPVRQIYGTVLLIVLAGIFFKLIWINKIGVYADEWGSLVDAKSLAERGTTVHFVNDVATLPYSRAYFILYLTASFMRSFGESLLAARFPVIVLSSLTALPFYFLGAKLNRKVGLISALLWLMSPWSMMIGRFVREYAVFPLLYLLIFWMLICLANRLLKLMEEGGKLSLKDWLIRGFGFLFPLYYLLAVDPQSTFEQVLLFYGVSVLYFAFIVWNSPRARRHFSKTRVFSALFITLLIAVPLYYHYQLSFARGDISWHPALDPVWTDILLGNHPRSWFYETGMYSVFLVLAVGTLAPLILFVRRKFPIAFFYVLTFYIAFYAYSFHFGRYIRPRYGFIMHVLLIPVLALGIYFLYHLLNPQRDRRGYTQGLLIVFLLFTFNPVNTYNSIFPKVYGFNTITEEHLYSFGEVAEKYGDDMKDQPILCTTCQPLFWYELADFQNNKIHQISLDPLDIAAIEAQVIDMREHYEHGWIILDQWRFRKEGLLREKSIKVQQYIFDFVDHLASFYLYKW